jgi:hypothetical protein
LIITRIRAVKMYYPSLLKDEQLDELIDMLALGNPVAGSAFIKICEDMKNAKEFLKEILPLLEDNEDIYKQAKRFIGRDL